jgi:hypothetical protein
LNGYRYKYKFFHLLRHLGGFLLFIYHIVYYARAERMAQVNCIMRDEIFLRLLGHKIHFYHLPLIIISIFYNTHEGWMLNMNVVLIYVGISPCRGKIIYEDFILSVISSIFLHFTYEIDHSKRYIHFSYSNCVTACVFVR